MVSRPGRGTKVTLVMPVVEAGTEPWTQIAEALEGAWGNVTRAVLRE
jgi:hypothetical protein